MPLHAFFSYLQVRVQVNLTVFRPEEGRTLCKLGAGAMQLNTLLPCMLNLLVAGGRVSKVGPDFVALLVLNIFNAAVGRDDIRTDLQHSAEVQCAPQQHHTLHKSQIFRCSDCSAAWQADRWQSQEQPKHTIGEGDLVRFTVLRCLPSS